MTTQTHNEKVTKYAEQLHDQLYILYSDKGQDFARFFGMSVNEAIARVRWELNQLLKH